jgi:alpha/beta superfamily hydrolase
MPEEPLLISAGEVTLEARYDFRDARRGALVCHPHPEYGGEMSNNVVRAAIKAFGSLGWTTLRFNFRGVGQSSGRYSEGLGEREDVRAAYNFLKGKGLRDIVVAGYSFGGWVAANALNNLDPYGLVLISPPIAVMEVCLRDLEVPCWILYGDRDPFCPEEQLRTLIEATPCVEGSFAIKGADHFYWGYEDQIKNALRKWFGNV